MPRIDGTGPDGMGPMTGRGRGSCNPSQSGYGPGMPSGPGYSGTGYGRGANSGRGPGQGPGTGCRRGRGNGRASGQRGNPRGRGAR